jgi:hypothetical protein
MKKPELGRMSKCSKYILIGLCNKLNLKELNPNNRIRLKFWNSLL